MSNAARLLGVFAHPDDETFCAGGAFARYAANGYEILVVSATRGQAGQIRSADLASRATLGLVRETELRQAGRALGVARVECWDYLDGSLQEIPEAELSERVESVISEFLPNLVVTFGDDGAYGHPDHVAISRATTAACARLWDSAYFSAPDLYHAAFPARRVLLQDRLVKWLIEQGPDFQGDPEFVYALLLLAEEATTLHSMDDHFEVRWFPAGISILEQGEPATALYLLLSGHADVIREDSAGNRTLVARLVPGQFFGEQGIATGKPRNAHVIAFDHATCLVFSPREPSLFEGRGAGARLVNSALSVASEEDRGPATTRIECGEFLSHKLSALAAYRSQFPMRPDMLPEAIFRDLFGVEYFARVFPRRQLETDFGIREVASFGWPTSIASPPR